MTRRLLLGGPMDSKHLDLPDTMHTVAVPVRDQTDWWSLDAMSPRAVSFSQVLYHRQQFVATMRHPCVMGAVVRRMWEVFRVGPTIHGEVNPSTAALIGAEPPDREEAAWDWRDERAPLEWGTTWAKHWSVDTRARLHAA